MSAYGEIERAFGDEEERFTFRLSFKEISQFEEKFDIPYMQFVQRACEGYAKVSELREVIRLALLGGGTEASKALKLIRQFVEERPPGETLPLAIEIIQAGAFGSDQYRSKKKPTQK